MKTNVFLGFSVLNDLMKKGLEEYKCDKVIATAYNINLKYVLSLFNEYENLEKFQIYSNDEKILNYEEDRDRLINMINNGSLELYHLTLNKKVIHAKVYGFFKDEECKLLAVGSPNLTSRSNLSIECLSIFEEIENDQVILSIWDKLSEMSEELKVREKDARAFIFSNEQKLASNIDEELFEGLWEHQKAILKWIASRYRSIVNVPPGTGKTKIALVYLEFLYQQKPNLSTIILVPTTALIEQWYTQLKELGFNVIIGEANIESMNKYIARPEKNILLTLYRRFFSNWEYIAKKIRMFSPTLLVITDECHSIYAHPEILYEFTRKFNDIEFFQLGLSATIDSFFPHLKEDYLNYCGGPNSIFDISLPSFYRNWNDRNEYPILKKISYRPSFYYLTKVEYEKYKEITGGVHAQIKQQTISGDPNRSMALIRAKWVKTLDGAIQKLQTALLTNIKEFNNGNVIIFVSTHDIAVEIRDFITAHKDWNPMTSAYIYDSAQPGIYRKYAMEQFKNNRGFCLVSEYMLAEGFDLPTVSHVVLHGSHRSERDWIQKIGRAIRYDRDSPDSVAIVYDIVVCNPKGKPLTLEKERYEVLSSISQL